MFFSLQLRLGILLPPSLSVFPSLFFPAGLSMWTTRSPLHRCRTGEHRVTHSLPACGLSDSHDDVFLLLVFDDLCLRLIRDLYCDAFFLLFGCTLCGASNATPWAALVLPARSLRVACSVSCLLLPRSFLQLFPRAHTRL